MGCVPESQPLDRLHCGTMDHVHGEMLSPLAHGDLPQGKYQKDLFYKLGEDGSLNGPSLCAVVRAMVEGAKDFPDSSMNISTITGGITNRLYRVGFVAAADGGVAPPPVLVRIFGAEGMIDRDLENATYASLAAQSDFLGYHGRFGNGRIETFLDGSKPLDLPEMADGAISARVAKAMARLHRLVLPTHLQPFYAKAGMWDQLWAWFAQAKRDIGEGKLSAWGPEAVAHLDRIMPDLLGHEFEKAEQELKSLQAAIPEDAPTAFCNNDLLAGNILKLANGEIGLIDFEYGGCNFRGFEIANHWNEWAGGTQVEMNGRCEYNRFPSPEQQRTFCRHYLEESGTASDETVETLVQEVQMFVAVNNWYWGLWALNQAVAEGVAPFDYLTYGEQRLTRYYSTKQATTSP